MITEAWYGSSLLSKAVFVVIAVIVISWLWPYLKTFVQKYLPKLIGQSTSDTILKSIDTAVISIDEYQARVALQTAASLFEKHGDTSTANNLRSCVATAMEWSNKKA